MAVLAGLAGLLILLTFFGPSTPDPSADPVTPAPLPTPRPAITPTAAPTVSAERAIELPLVIPTIDRDVPASSVPAPVLGEPTGMWLFYGGADRLQRLDLDTGSLDTFGIRALPLTSSGGELVLMTSGTGLIGWVGLHDPAEQAEGWVEARVARANEPGFLWLFRPEEELWSRLDLRDNRIVERRVAPRQIVLPTLAGDAERSLIPGPDIVDTPSGIYEWSGDRYLRATTGTLLDFNEEIALIEQCGDELDDCEQVWLDRGTWTPVDLPPLRPPIRTARLVGNDRWLYTISNNGAISALLSLETGRRAPLPTPAESLAVSPDGRWLAVDLAGENVLLVDLDAGHAVQILDAFAQDLGGSLLFVQAD